MTDKPWLRTYPLGLPPTIDSEFDTILSAFEATVAHHSDAVAISYFDGELSFSELDARANAVAVALLERGFHTGDRLALYTQNNPAFVVGLLAAWKAGGAAALINPMNKARELRYLLEDSGAVALLCLDDLHDSVAREVIDQGGVCVRDVLIASAHDDQMRCDSRVFTAAESQRTSTSARRLADVIEAYRDRVVPPVSADPTAAAVLTYTSGTTGVPKGVNNTQAGIAFNSQTYRDWMKLDEHDVILGIAPLFHITGLVGHVCLSLLSGARLVLLHRFDGAVVLDAIREHKPTFTVGAITAFSNIATQPGATPADFASLRAVYSGGAPISPRTRDAIRDRTGMDVHNIYGMTETTSPTHAVPLGVSAPVDAATGALSIGLPVFNTEARIVDDNGIDLPHGEIGELLISGPQVAPGYWNKPEQTAEKIIGGELHTGDVGLMDDQGWFYLVDRKSDMIIASGYKVWPREIEDVLLNHPAVREAVVVGVNDAYRGETVKAVVTLHADSATSTDELIAYCKSELAAYKYPRIIDVVDELPRNAAGKIVRRALR